MLSITTDLCDVYFQPDEDEEVDLGELFSPRNIEVNYDFECTPLFHAIQRQNWEETAEIATEYPEQVRTWVHRYDGQNRRSLRWRMLPIHALFVFSGTHDLAVLFLFIYPESAQLTDDQRMLPLHLACRNGAEESTIEEILSAFPQALTETDYKGRTPLDLVKTSTYCHKEELLAFLIEYDGNNSSNNRLAHNESAFISRTIDTTEHRDNTEAAVSNHLKPKSNLFMKSVQFHPNTGGTYVSFSDALKKGPKSPRVLRIATEKKKASTLGKLEMIAKEEKKQRCFQTVVVDPIPPSRNAEEDEREQPEIFYNNSMDKFVDPQTNDLYERDQPPNSNIGIINVSDPRRNDLSSESSSRLDSIDDTTISEKSTLIDKALIAFECGEQMESSVESLAQTTPSHTLSSSSSSSWSASTSESVSSTEQSSNSIRTDLTFDSKGQFVHKNRPKRQSIEKNTESQTKLLIQSLRKQRLQQLVQSIDDGIHETAENQDDGASGNKEILMNAVADSVARSGVTSIHLIPEESIITDIIGIIEEAFTESKGNDVGTESSAENSNSAPLADAKQEQRMSFENEAQEETANDSGINLKIECGVSEEESEKNEEDVGTESSAENSNSAPLADAKQEQRMSFENEAQEETAYDSGINLKIECSVSEEESEKNEDDVGKESSAENSNSAPLVDAKQVQRMSFENEAQEEIANDSEINLKIECSVSEEESEKNEALSKTNSSENIPTHTEIVCNEWIIYKKEANEDDSLEHDERLKLDAEEEEVLALDIVVAKDETSNTSEHISISEQIESSLEQASQEEYHVCIEPVLLTVFTVSKGANLEKEECFTKNKVIDPEFHLEDGKRVESSSGIEEDIREKTILELKQSSECDLKEEVDEKPDEDVKHVAHDDVRRGEDRTLQLSAADECEIISHCDKQCQSQPEDTTFKRDIELISSSELVTVQISSQVLFPADEKEKNVAEESLTALNPHINVSVEDLKNSDVEKVPFSFDIDDQVESVRPTNSETLKEDFEHYHEDFHFIDLSCHIIHLSDSDEHEAMQVKGCSDSSPISETTRGDICCSADAKQMEEKGLIVRKSEKEQESAKKSIPVAVSKQPKGHKWESNDPVPSYARFRTTKTIVNSRVNFPVVVNANAEEREKVRKNNGEYKKPSMRLRASWVVPSTD